jgi:HEAT repeat protein
MESRKLNSVQIILLVTQLMSERRFDELGDLARQDERVFNHLVQTLRDGRGPFCFFAATGLSKAGESAVEPLLEALQDGQHVVRQVAALALGEIGDLRAVGGLVEGLEDEYEAVRQAVAVSLGKLGAVEAIEPLLRAIRDESEIVRRAVVNALGMIGDERALPELKRVEAEDTEAVAERAREVIGEIGEREE